MGARPQGFAFLCGGGDNKKTKIFFQKTSLLGNIWHIKYRGMLATHINRLAPGLSF